MHCIPELFDGGTAVSSVASTYFTDGSIDMIFFWDPAMAAEAQLQIALLLTQVETGTNLNVPGYESLTKLDGHDNAFVGNAALEADANTISARFLIPRSVRVCERSPQKTACLCAAAAKPGTQRAILDAVDLALLQGREPGVWRWRLDPATSAAA
jgi:hypothetical protein